jgi:apolipoprotein N-acyltransferase
MKTNQEINQLLKKWLWVSFSIVISGLCWYFSNGLTGEYWYLLWIAPIPIIYISIKATGRQTFFISFISYLIGRLSWFVYLVSVATLIPAIFFTLILSFSFALILVLTRKVILKTILWLSVLAFPVFFTAYEFLMLRFSADGTATSIAYSQSNVLPVIQIASITGILGITFMVTFIPSAIAVCLAFIKQKSKIRFILISSGVILLSVLLFGILRINYNSDKNSVKAGLVVLEEKYHDMSKHPDFLKDTLVTRLYENEISKLAEQDAKMIVLPERAININKETENIIIGMLSNAALKNQVYIITGYTNFKNKQEFNSALVISDEGKIVADYNKAHLVTGLENRFTHGGEIGLFKMQDIQMGISICKDLDFPAYIRKYGKADLNVLTIPAWDFGIDDWLHSRMSILRGVENGFSEIRTAREGRLTISDCFGRVNYESSSSKRQKSILIGNASLQRISTFYTRFGDWFGILVLICAFCFVIALVKNKSKIK